MATVWYKLGLDERAPMRASPGAAGFDLFAAEDATLLPGATVAVGTGVALEIQPGLEGQVRGRSGLALQGVLCHFGTVDSDYRGEVKVILHNLSPRPYAVVRGDRIAQLVFAAVADVQLEAAETLSPTARGAGGLGSTGR